MPALLNPSSTVIQPQQPAATGRFSLSKDEVPARVTATGLAGLETVTIKSIDGPSEILTDVKKAGVAVTLTASDPVFVLDGPGPYELGKGVTAGNVGAFVAKG